MIVLATQATIRLNILSLIGTDTKAGLVNDMKMEKNAPFKSVDKRLHIQKGHFTIGFISRRGPFAQELRHKEKLDILNIDI